MTNSNGNSAATEAEARLAGILAIAADAIIGIDENHLIALFNDGAEQIFGYPRAEVLRQPLSILLPERFRRTHDGLVRAFGAASHVARRMGERQEIFGRRKNGEEFPAEASISKLDVEGRRTYTVVLRDITERKLAQLALAASHAELESRVAARTAELQAEMRRREDIQAQLVRTQRMEAFGQLTGGVAHDFNNLLTVITGNLELLEIHISDEKSRTLLGRAHGAAEMGARLTARLLTFARRRQFETTALDLNDQITGMLELLHRTLGEHIDLTTRLAPQLWTVRADPSEIENAVLNLAINARDAMGKGGKIVVETENVTAEDSQIGGATKLPAGDYVRLSVSDTGTGMPPAVLQRAFEPFFTTKTQGKGTGLGLSTIYGFVQSLGGTASIYSEQGRGTSVNLYLPRLAGDTAPQPVTDRSDVPMGTGETVLLVEDNLDVRQAALLRLQALGYAVIEAEHGTAALERLEAGFPVAVVFSDVVMPGGMSGLDLARQVQARWPAIKVVLTSGYAEDVLREHGAGAAPPRILRKPYSRAGLARAIRQALDA